jgi:hypothetical protein
MERLEDAENDLQELKMNRRRGKRGNGEIEVKVPGMYVCVRTHKEVNKADAKW